MTAVEIERICACLEIRADMLPASEGAAVLALIEEMASRIVALDGRVQELEWRLRDHLDLDHERS